MCQSLHLLSPLGSDCSRGQRVPPCAAAFSRHLRPFDRLARDRAGPTCDESVAPDFDDAHVIVFAGLPYSVKVAGNLARIGAAHLMLAARG